MRVRKVCSRRLTGEAVNECGRDVAAVDVERYVRRLRKIGGCSYGLCRYIRSDKGSSPHASMSHRTSQRRHTIQCRSRAKVSATRPESPRLHRQRLVARRDPKTPCTRLRRHIRATRPLRQRRTTRTQRRDSSTSSDPKRCTTPSAASGTVIFRCSGNSGRRP